MCPWNALSLEIIISISILFLVKKSNLGKVHVDSLADIWVLLNDVPDLLHGLSVKISQFTHIKIFLWREKAEYRVLI